MSATDSLTEAAARDCPACGGADRAEVARLAAEQFCKVNSTYRADFAAILGVRPDAVYPLVRCRGCGFVYAALLPPPAFLGRVYDEVIDPDRGFFESCSPGWVAHQLTLGGRLLGGLAGRYGEDVHLKVLDFGCGYGALVRALGGPRVSCRGFETSPRRLAYLRGQQLPASDSLEETAAEGPYHGVVLSDVLEHVPSPRETLALCRGLLADGGLLLVHVPDFGDRRLAAALADIPAGRQTRELNPWEHLNYFSPASLRRMIEAAGFRVPEPAAVDVGLRPGLRGGRRWGNALKSALRLARHALGAPPEETTVLAERLP
jgi:SAM-dependent methyltransferase